MFHGGGDGGGVLGPGWFRDVVVVVLCAQKYSWNATHAVCFMHHRAGKGLSFSRADHELNLEYELRTKISDCDTPPHVQAARTANFHAALNLSLGALQGKT